MEDAKKTVPLDVATATSTGSDPVKPDQDPATNSGPKGERELNLDRPKGAKR